MNSPSSALIWELWWKNRWGFGLLAALLLLCTGLRFHVARLDANADKLREEFQSLTHGSLSLDGVLPRPGGDPVASQGNIEIGTVEYSGPLAPGDQLTWSGYLLDGMVPVITVTLNNLQLAELQHLPFRILITVPDGGKRTVPLARGLESAQSALNAQGLAQSWRTAALSWSLLSFSFSLLIVFATFGSVELHASRGFTGIPPRRFTLPVSTWMLVCWPLALGALTVVVLCLVWWGLVLRGLTPGFVVPVFYLTTLFTSGLTVFQALVWGLASFGKARTAGITLFMLGLVSLAMLPLSDHFAHTAWFAEFGKQFAALGGIGVCAAGTVAWAGVTQERRGRWTGWTKSAWLGRWSDRFYAPPPEFTSALQAQIWMEWRRNGRVALIDWTVLVWVGLGVCFLSDEAGFGSLLIVAGGWMAVTGLNLARDPASRRLALSSFTAARPVRSGDLLLAKLMAGAALWGTAILILGASVYLFVVSSGRLDRLPDVLGLVIILLASSFHIFIGVLPFCLWGRTPGFPWSLLPLLGVYAIAVNFLRDTAIARDTSSSFSSCWWGSFCSN